jgi:ABC-type transport system substrate-binding protein
MPHALAPGSEVSGYRIVSLLGEGATGAVYLARDAEGAAVALKVLDPAVAADARFRERFVRESRVAALLDHPNIVSVRDAGEDAGLFYIAMEWVDGVDLRSLLRRDGPLEPERAVALIADVAAALDVAHAAGLVHRDVKPANILVAGDQAQLCDFGLAKHTASAESLTGERMLVGTVAYIAPEQIEGAGVDGRSDVYSLGCVLYECLTGEPPFDRESELAVLYAHLNEPSPRPSASREELPPALDEVVAAALAKSPAERPQSGGELAGAARAALRGEAPRRRGRRRAPALLVAAGVLAAAAAAAVALSGGADDAPGRPELRLGSDVLASIDARSGRVVSRVRLPGRPDELVQGGRSTWVLLDDRRRVVTVDGRRRKVSPPVRLPFAAGGIAPGAGGLWVAEAAGPRIALVGSRGVKRRFSVGSGAEHAGPLAVGFGSVWLGRGPEVLRVDPDSGRVRARVSTPVEVTTVRAADDAVWVVSGQEGRIAKIDPATARVIARNRIHGWAADLAVGGGFAWLAVVPDDVVFKLSADDLAVAGTTRARPRPDVLSWGAGRLWASTGAGRSLLQVGGESARSELRLDAIPVGVAAAGGRLWTATLPLPAAARPAGKGGELRAAIAADGVDTDPATSLSPDIAQLRYATCAGLMAYPDAAGAAGRRLVPEVAAAPPTLSPDRRTYTFRIRPGYRFSPPSGEPLTAETFRATLERTLSPRLGKTSIAMSILGDIEGAADYHAGTARHVRGLAASGDRLTIRLTRPAGDLPVRLAMPLFCPVPPRTPAVPGGTPKALPSAGPYYIATQERGRTVLERNPNYHGARPRRPDRIVYLTGVGAAEALRRADKGEVDYVPYDYDNHGPLAVGGKRDRAFGATSPSARRGDQRFFANPAPGLDMLALNPRRPLFRDLAMRRAVNVALDRPALAAVWGELPTDRYVPPAILPVTGRSRYPLSGPDVAAARRLAAGRRGTATLYYCGDPGNQRVAEIVRTNLRPIGIAVRITPSLACLRGHDPKADAADIALLSPGSLALDAAGFLALAGGDGEKFGELPPRGWGRDDAFLRRVARADALPGAERDAAFAALQEEALEKSARLAAFSGFVRPEYVAPRIACRVRQGAYQFLDLGAACVRAA